MDKPNLLFIFSDKASGLLSDINTPFLSLTTCDISGKTITGLNLDKLSNTTFGEPSVYEGNTKILHQS